MAVVLTSGGLMSVGTPIQQARATFKTPKKKSSSSGGSSSSSGSSSTNQNQSTKSNVTPTATVGMTEQSIQQQIVKSQKPASNNILGQLQKEEKRVPQVAEIRPYSASDRQKYLSTPGGYYKQNIFESLRQLPGKVKTLGPTIQYGKKGEGFLSPLQYSEKMQKDVVFSTIPAFGTVTPQTSSGFIKQTYGQKQAEIESQFNLKQSSIIDKYEKLATKKDKEFQEKIEKGADFNKTVQEQNAFYNQINKELKSELDKNAEKTPSVLGIGGRTGKVRQNVELVGDLAVAGVSTANPIIGALYFTGVKGLYKGTTASTKEQKIGAALDQAIGIGYLGGAVSKAGKSVVQAELLGKSEALSNQPLRFEGIQVGRKSGTVSLAAQQNIKGAQRNVVISGDFITKGDNLFLMKGSKGVSSTKGVLDFKTVPFRGTDPKYFLDVQKFTVGSKGLSVPLGDKASFTLAKNTFQPTSSVGSVFQMTKGVTSPIYSFSSKGGKATIGTTGTFSVKSGDDIYSSTGGDIIYQKGKGPTGIDYKTFGKTKVIESSGSSTKGFESLSDDLVKYYKGSGSTKTPFSSTFSDDIAKGLSGGTKQNTKQGLVSLQRDGVKFKGSGATSVGSTVSKGLSQTTKQLTQRSSLIVPAVLSGTKASERLYQPSINQQSVLVSISNKLKPRTSLAQLSSLESGQIQSSSLSGRTNLTSKSIGVSNIVPNIITPYDTKINPRTNFEIIPSVPPFKYDGLPQLGGQKGSGRRKSRQTLGYTPSLTGTTFKIKGTPEYLGKGIGYNPLKIRGISSLKKKKKKKK